MKHQYWVYIITNKKYGTLYIGVTNDIARRHEEHKAGKAENFTGKYKLTHIVYAESYSYIDDAIAREKKLKEWQRLWKIELIEKSNPSWASLNLS